MPLVNIPRPVAQEAVSRPIIHIRAPQGRSGSVAEAFQHEALVLAKNVVHPVVQAQGVTSLREWFGGPHDLEVIEEVKGLGEYGRTLTVLTMDTFADELEEKPVERWAPPTF